VVNAPWVKGVTGNLFPLRTAAAKGNWGGEACAGVW